MVAVVGGTPWGLLNYILTESKGMSFTGICQSIFIYRDSNKFPFCFADEKIISRFLLTHQCFTDSAEVLAVLKD